MRRLLLGEVTNVFSDRWNKPENGFEKLQSPCDVVIGRYKFPEGDASAWRSLSP